jgi:hypothetical protein
LDEGKVKIESIKDEAVSNGNNVKATENKRLICFSNYSDGSIIDNNKIHSNSGDNIHNNTDNNTTKVLFSTTRSPFLCRSFTKSGDPSDHISLPKEDLASWHHVMGPKAWKTGPCGRWHLSALVHMLAAAATCLAVFFVLLTEAKKNTAGLPC